MSDDSAVLMIRIMDFFFLDIQMDEQLTSAILHFCSASPILILISRRVLFFFFLRYLHIPKSFWSASTRSLNRSEAPLAQLPMFHCFFATRVIRFLLSALNLCASTSVHC